MARIATWAPVMQAVGMEDKNDLDPDVAKIKGIASPKDVGLVEGVGISTMNKDTPLNINPEQEERILTNLEHKNGRGVDGRVLPNIESWLVLGRTIKISRTIRISVTQKGKRTLRIHGPGLAVPPRRDLSR